MVTLTLTMLEIWTQDVPLLDIVSSTLAASSPGAVAYSRL
jgi:hypothetical protein